MKSFSETKIETEGRGQMRELPHVVIRRWGEAGSANKAVRQRCTGAIVKSSKKASLSNARLWQPRRKD
jgi:hypothetical protein